MKEAEIEKTSVKIFSSSSTVFLAVGEVIKFDGFLKNIFRFKKMI